MQHTYQSYNVLCKQHIGSTIPIGAMLPADSTLFPTQVRMEGAGVVGLLQGSVQGSVISPFKWLPTYLAQAILKFDGGVMMVPL